MKMSEISLRIGNAIIHGRNITLIHTEDGKCIIEYFDDVCGEPRYEKFVRIEAKTTDVDIFRESDLLVGKLIADRFAEGFPE